MKANCKDLNFWKKNLQDDLERVKKSFIIHKSNKNRKRNYKKKSISWEEALLLRKRKETHSKKDSTARNNSTTAGTNDENALPSDKEAAEARVAEREEKLERLKTEIAEREKSMPLFERVKEINKYGFTVTLIILAARTVIGAVIGAITNSLKSLGKGIGKGMRDIGKKGSVRFARLHRLDREFDFQSCRKGHLIFGETHLAYNASCGRLFYRKVPQAQPLMFPSKNCSHNDQRLVYVVTCGRWSGWRGWGWGNGWLLFLLFHCRLVD